MRARTGSTPIAVSRRSSAGLLAPGGIVCLEIGAGQEETVRALFAAQGFTIESRRDLSGVVRCLILCS